MIRSTPRLFLLLSAGLLPACDDGPRGGPIEVVRTVAAPDVDLDASGAKRFGYEAPPPLFLFDLPENWREIEPAPLRDLNFTIPGVGAAGDAECYASLLQGGGTLDNVNRWRGQMSLDPYSDDELAALPVVDVVGRRSVLVDIEGTFQSMSGEAQDEYRLLGVYAAFPAFGFSVKMIGPRETVTAERDAFVRFVESLLLNPERFGGMPGMAAGSTDPTGGARDQDGHDPHDGHDHAAHASASVDPSELTWIKPAHWTVGEGSSMRVVTFDVPDSPGSQCWVTVLPGTAGGVLMNLNRWRREVGLDPITEGDLDSLPHLRVLGRDSVLLEVEGGYQGMSGPRIDEALLFGVVCDLGDSLMFVKMVGPKSDLSDERSHFIAFCESLSS